MNPNEAPSGRTDLVPPAPAAKPLTRRSFLTRSIAATLAAGGATIGAGGLDDTELLAKEVDPRSRLSRANFAYRLRCKAALGQRRVQPALHPTNGDEELYPNRIGNFSKGLPHNSIGEVDPAAYELFLRALKKGHPEEFEAIPMGASSPTLQRKLVNPQAGLAFDLEGADSHALAIPPAPTLDSKEAAGEMVENYWMALARDVPFEEYGTNAITLAAAHDLTRLQDFRGPKIALQVTPQTLFRDTLPGATTGPYISQFLLLPVPFGANYVEQMMRTAVPGVDYMTTFADWLSVQRGERPSLAIQHDSQRRYIRNGRDLGQWVHIDVLFQAYLHAMLILLAGPDADDPDSSGLGVPFDAGNPYHLSANQDGFATFGGPHIATLLCEVSTRALKAAWFQKWCVHRRLRPEAYAGLVHNRLNNVASYPLAMDEITASPALSMLSSKYGSYLLPMAFPEGSPLHPSYAAGHATVAGACVTILKAWFDDSMVIPNPVVPSADGLSLLPYSGSLLTVGGELNKLASNIATGRNIAGVHWRSDARESLALGEAVGISVLKDQRLLCNEDFAGFTLTKFDGTVVTV
ncbi:MAG: vanadium-dependent haloperoxidase [Chthoniobacteraceae bacterium]